jgi:hypothetical protein
MWELMEKMGEEPAMLCCLADGTFRIATLKMASLLEGVPTQPASSSFWDKVLDHGPA